MYNIDQRQFVLVTQFPPLMEHIVISRSAGL